MERRLVFVSIESVRVNRKKLKKLSAVKIMQYAHDYERGDVLPPILVEDCGGFYTVRDGRHRLQAQLVIGCSFIEIQVYQDEVVFGPPLSFCYDKTMYEKRPKLIFINGPVAAGKSTLAQRYADDHKLALVLNSDDFVGSMGQWHENEDEARRLALGYVLMIAREHVKAGYDVVIPFLLIHTEDIMAIEQMADETGARLYEVGLIAPKDKAMAWAFERGTWGEPGAPLITEEDGPIIEDLYDRFERTLDGRTKSVHIEVRRGDIEGTYRDLMRSVSLC